MSEPDKKTLRHFYCRDLLWQAFERMSEDFDRGMDDLINESMAAMARDKDYLAGPRVGRQPQSHSEISLDAPTPIPTAPRMPVAAPAPPPPRAPTHSVPPPLPPPRMTAPRPAVPSGAPMFPPTPSADPGQTPAPPLYLIFDNRKYRIDKEQFIIGRGVKSSDLPIRDGNISRKHCAVVRRNGAYFIKDLGSTNGIDFNGNRVDNRRIEEGDTFFLCEYQLRFTFSA
ncbi:MAG: FHA domain-containing protein [Deltaproteobacteria bacterium]|nr:FHA domain-containing protein [Deltaproteobacteria bacterium]